MIKSKPDMSGRPSEILQTRFVKFVIVCVLLYSIIPLYAARAVELCGRWDSIDVLGGEYRISNNVWGGGPGVGEQCLEAYPDSTYFAVYHSTHNDSGVCSYPFILRGCHWGSCTQDSGMPIMVNNVISAPFSWSVDTNGAGGTWNVAYESWFSVAGGTAPDAAELMIWINYNGGAGPAGSYQGTVSIGGHSWDVYFVDWTGSAGWYYIAYKITSPADNVNLDLRDFMDDAIARGFLDPSWYLDAMEAGFEIWRDGEGLTSNSFSASVIGIDNDPPSVSITSPSNGATFNHGDTIVIEADASDGDGSVTKVEFYQGSTKLGEDTSSPYSYTWHYVLPGYYTLTARATDNNNATTTSLPVNITVTGGEGSGAVLREWWTGVPGMAVIDLTSSANYPDNPTGKGLLTNLEGPTDWANNYGTRIRGYLHPLTTGNYTFWIASDDNGELWLSTDDSPANAARIAYVLEWTNSREWNKDPNQQSLPISLTAGQKYYVEVLQKEGSGGDNVAVAWQGPGLSQQVINGAYLSPCCLDFRDFAGFGDRWGRSDCDAANDWCGGFDSDRDGSILLDDLQVFVDSWLVGIE
ncbi:MAG: Ig-like domain-containing protein [Sedimentisphaerales bacterium]|nr:Ig-like domain-containing protein [Sedimentisphaerales bacterium]